MNVSGIDPGKSGAVAFLAPGIQEIHDCPTLIMNGKKHFDERGMATLIRIAILKGVQIAFMEKVHTMPEQGVTSMFTFGQGFGIWLGILACQRIPYELVSPMRWKRDMLADIPGKDNKARAVIAAKRLFPDAPLTGKKDHNKAAALLIAEWGRRKVKNQHLVKCL